MFSLHTWISKADAAPVPAVEESSAMPPTQSSSTSTTSSSEATTPRRRRPWKDAFAHSCSSRGSLTVSVREVTADSEVADVPTSSQVLYWNDTAATKEALTRLFQEQSATAKARETAAAKASPSLVSSVASTIFEYGVKSPVKMAIRYMLHDDDEDEYDVPDVDSDIHVGEDEPLLNPDVAVDCLLFLRQTMLRHASDTLVLALPGGAATAATELLNWTHGVLKTTSDQGRMGTLVAQLETSQMEFLAEILMASGLVEVVSRGGEGDDLLVLIPPADARQREQRMALYDLQLAIAKNEMRMAELTAKMEVCTKRALESNKTGNRKVALQHMAARKRLTVQLVQVEGALVNLTGQFHALEGALHTQKFVQVTKQTAAALKSLRPDLDEVDDVMLDLEEELEADRRMNDTLSNMVMTDTTGPTDDDLLAELAGLTLEDAPEKKPAAIKPVPPVDDAALEAKLAALGESLGSLPAATGKQAVAS